LIGRLHDEDEVSIVTYDDDVNVLLPLSSVESVRGVIARTLANVRTGGSTNLHGGWLAGAEQIATRPEANRICRVMLLSDGQANAGMTSTRDICSQVSQLACTGVTTSTVGIGLGFNEELMTEMATAGQGTAMYGDRAADLVEPFEAELGLLAHTVWRNVTLTMHSLAKRWTMHNDYPILARNAWRMVSIAANSEAWMALSVPMHEALDGQLQDQVAPLLHVTVKATDAEGVEHIFSAQLEQLPVVSERAWREMPTDERVAGRFNEIEAADLQRLAREAVRERDWRAVERMLDELRDRARDNPWLQATVGVLANLLANRDHERMEKELMFSSNRIKSRLSEVDEGQFQSMQEEDTKPAWLRRKENQGRGSGL
jgi:Ca-activated chloride channel family protein